MLNLSPVAPVPGSHVLCCIVSYPAAVISRFLQVLQFLCNAWAFHSTQYISFSLPDFYAKCVVILSIILLYAMHYFSPTVFFLKILSLTSSYVTIICLDVVLLQSLGSLLLLLFLTHTLSHTHMHTVHSHFNLFSLSLVSTDKNASSFSNPIYIKLK